MAKRLIALLTAVVCAALLLSSCAAQRPNKYGETQKSKSMLPIEHRA